MEHFKRKYMRMIDKIEEEREFSKTWIYVDLDMFYVAIEMRDNPLLKDKACVVGIGVVSTANYIARKLGITSGMPLQVAMKISKLRNQFLIIIKNNSSKYIKASKKFMEIMKKYDPDMENRGLDESKIEISGYL